MENVKGILTKDEGRIKERILREIRSIVDPMSLQQLLDYIDAKLRRSITPALYASLTLKLKMEAYEDSTESIEQAFFDNLDNQLRELTTKHLTYNISKSNEAVNTIRHGLFLLRERQSREEIRKRLIQLKTSTHLDNDRFVDKYNAVVETVSTEDIFDSIQRAIDDVATLGNCKEDADVIKKSLMLYVSTFDECIDFIRKAFPDKEKTANEFDKLLQRVRLYNIDKPIVVMSANYGVPQNRERVLFIGCRNDQDLITEVPPL